MDINQPMVESSGNLIDLPFSIRQLRLYILT